MNRQEMQNAATERVDNVREALDQITQFAGGRNDGETKLFNLFDLAIELFASRADGGFARTEHAGKGAVNCIAGAIDVRMNGNADVGAIGPMLPALFIEEIRFGFEETDLR